MRCVYVLHLSILFSLVVLQGCATQQSQKAESQFLRGMVSKTPEGFYITPCYSQEARLLTNTGAVSSRFKEQTLDEQLPVYMELKAYQQADLKWLVESISVASGNSQSCRFDLSDIRLRAGGASPMWIADVLENSIRVQMYQDLRTLKFPVKSTDKLTGTWTSDLKGVRGESYSLTLTIKDQSCKDELNSWYRLTAEMSVNGDQFFGCAREGDTTKRSIVGSYSNELKDEQVFVVLDLKEEHIASMLLDYRNGQPLIVMAGEWKWSDNEKLVLHFMKRDGNEEQSIMWLKRAANGSLVQDGFSPHFGRSGVELRRSE